MSIESARERVEDTIASMASGGVDHILAWWAARRASDDPSGITGQLDMDINALIREVEHRWGVNISEHMQQGCAECRRYVDEQKARLKEAKHERR